MNYRGDRFSRFDISRLVVRQRQLVRSRFQQLSSAQLEELAEALLDLSTTKDLVTWLQTHQA